MLGVVTQGDKTCAATEDALGTSSETGVFALLCDLSNMVTSDVIQIRLKVKVRASGTGSTARTVAYAQYSGAQTEPTDVVLGPVPSALEVTATIKQTGTGAGGYKVVPWSLVRIG